MPDIIKILAIHGLGDQRATGWDANWRAAIEAVVPQESDVHLDFNFLGYDHVFETVDLTYQDTIDALWKLARSGAENIFRRERGYISNLSDRVRWTAGYVVAWVDSTRFRRETRALVLDTIEAYQPDVILAHSLGSLIAYSALAHRDAKRAKKALARAHFVTFGSQLGNPFVIGNVTGGRVIGLDVKHWHHLYNLHDDIFTAPLNVQGVPNFTQLLTPFDREGFADHAAEAYLGHEVTQGSFWAPLVAEFAEGRGGRRGASPWARRIAGKRPPRRRALLVGIDTYPDEANRLYGCVNDVFSISAALQDCGFEPEEIRVCFNERATREGILSRLGWLVDGAAAGDELVFYYSGHGAQIPEYGMYHEPDRLTETLVPYDFDWSPERCVSDEQIYALYAQLPYDLQFLMIFDCCHSGSMHRQGGARVRSVTPPDDIRHRQLKWDRRRQMWVDRTFEPLNKRFTTRAADRSAFFGENGATVRLGRAAPLRLTDKKTYEEKRDAAADKIAGPFLPLVIEACGESEYSYEYRHGVTSYGAFTFCLTSILRSEKNLTFDRLVALVRAQLSELGYRQTPQILGPSKYRNARVPLQTGRGGDEPPPASAGSETPRTSG